MKQDRPPAKTTAAPLQRQAAATHAGTQHAAAASPRQQAQGAHIAQLAGKPQEKAKKAAAPKAPDKAKKGGKP